jgi:hypothetical protein
MHFYARTDNGVEPRHYVPMSKDPSQLRPSRLTDAKKAAKDGEIWVPSVTTILNVLAKPALINWKIDQHLKIAHGFQFRSDDRKYGFEDEFIAEVKRLAETEMDKAPSAGTDFHKEMEKYINGELTTADESYQLCYDAMAVIYEKTGGVDDWATEISFVSNGYGGQVDLATIGWIIDFKTKQEAAKFKPGKMAYDDHYTQLGAYREGMAQPFARCANLFVCLEDGQIDFHEHKEEDLQKGWQIFQNSLAIFNLQKGY